MSNWSMKCRHQEDLTIVTNVQIPYETGIDGAHRMLHKTFHSRIPARSQILIISLKNKCPEAKDLEVTGCWHVSI